jgi:hypothetical protein
MKIRTNRDEDNLFETDDGKWDNTIKAFWRRLVRSLQLKETEDIPDNRMYLFRAHFCTSLMVSPIKDDWTVCKQELPPINTPVMVVMSDNSVRILELLVESPTWDETYQAFKYWSDPNVDIPIEDGVDTVIYWKELGFVPEIPEETEHY